MSINSPTLLRSLSVVALVALGVMVIPYRARAAEDDKRLQTSDRVGDEVAKAGAAMGATPPDYVTAISILKAILPSAIKGSFDEAVVSITLAQAILNSEGKTGDTLQSAIPHLIKAIESGFWKIDRIGEWIFLVAYLHQQNNETAKAVEWAKRYLAEVEIVAAERIIFYASLALAEAELGGSKPEVITEILKQIERGLHMVPHPQENLYLLKAVALQTLGRMDEAAEVLELTVSLFPDRQQFWAQLLSLYAVTGQDLRAALTIERAQERGLMRTPRENGGLVSLYFNLGRYNQVIEILRRGLADGSIDPTERNWDTLVFALQNAHRNNEVIPACEAAAKLFEFGKYDAMIAYRLFEDGKTKEAFNYAERAIEKGSLDKLAQFTVFTAFLAYEAKEFEAASEHLAKAEPLLESDREKSDFNNLRRAVNQQLELKEREAADAAEEAAAQAEAEAKAAAAPSTATGNP